MNPITTVALALFNYDRDVHGENPVESFDCCFSKNHYLNIAKFVVDALGLDKSVELIENKENEDNKKFVLSWKKPVIKSSKNPLVTAMESVINDTIVDIYYSIEQKEWDMAAMYAQDCDDYVTIRKLLSKGCLKKSYKAICKMDTAPRDMIPNIVRKKVNSFR